jgi:hypothetical protein
MSNIFYTRTAYDKSGLISSGSITTSNDRYEPIQAWRLLEGGLVPHTLTPVLYATQVREKYSIYNYCTILPVPGAAAAEVQRVIDAVSVPAAWFCSSCLFGDGAAELSFVYYHLRIY